MAEEGVSIKLEETCDFPSASEMKQIIYESDMKIVNKFLEAVKPNFLQKISWVIPLATNVGRMTESQKLLVIHVLREKGYIVIRDNDVLYVKLP